MAQASGSSSFPPPPPQKGDDVAFWANQLTRWLKKTQAIPGANIFSTQTQSGRVFNAKPGAGGGAAIPPKMWDILPASDPLKVSIFEPVIAYTRPRSTEANPINGTVYSRISGEDPTITLPSTGTRIIYIRIEYQNEVFATVLVDDNDGGNIGLFHQHPVIDEAVVLAGTTVPDPDYDYGDGAIDGYDYYRIGEVETLDGEIVSIKNYSPLTDGVTGSGNYLLHGHPLILTITSVTKMIDTRV